jgi:murein DD-endopeptidase MepM/ murein hydrolase activator NlpD
VTRRSALLALAGIVLGAGPSAAATHRYRGLTVDVDESAAFQGGMVAVAITSRRPVRGIVYAVLDGRRCPGYWTEGAVRALAPVPVTHPAGRTTLGIEIRSARGRQRFAIPITVAARAYPPRETILPDTKRALASTAASVRDGRRLQLVLRTVSPRREWSGPFAPPVDAPPAPSFGTPHSYPGVRALESTADAIHGEYHRGLDYEVAPGTAVRSPAAATVAFSGDLALTGRTIVLDHGQGLLSVLAHLATVDVREGEQVEAGRVLGTSGDSGVALEPHVHWGVYLHGVAIDPRVTAGL